MLACGLDFGTSNSSLTLVQDGVATPLVLEAAHHPPQTMPTLLYFSDEHRRFYGNNAIAEYLEQDMAGRFVQAVKRHLPSATFTQTFIQGQAMGLPELIAGFLEHLKTAAERHAGQPVERVVLGRPAVFHVDPARDRLAQERLRQAASLAGFVDIEFQIEPIAAARSFEAELERDTLCLVGDLGGGTSDFTLMRLGPSRARTLDRRGDVLAADGVDVAGNDLDAALVHLKVLPRLGYHASWKPLGRPVPVPTRLHMAVTSWHRLSFAGTDENLRELDRWIRSADDAIGLKRLRNLLDWNLGFSLFQSIERCKVELSEHDEGVLSFRGEGIVLEEPVSRREFDTAVGPLMAQLGRCMDGVLDQAGVDHDDVGLVFLTGGTSLVPCVRALFERRFPGRLLEREAFTSVGQGLGLEAQARFGEPGRT